MFVVVVVMASLYDFLLYLDVLSKSGLKKSWNISEYFFLLLSRSLPKSRKYVSLEQ